MTPGVPLGGASFVHPQGNVNLLPSGRLPKDGYYFDVIVRQDPIDESDLRPEDWVAH
jgi:hypothetical protein